MAGGGVQRECEGQRCAEDGRHDDSLPTARHRRQPRYNSGQMNTAITVNGEHAPIAPGTPVSRLIGDLGLAGQRLAVELNGAVVPRSRHDSTLLAAGDRVEIVRAIGGG